MGVTGTACDALGAATPHPAMSARALTPSAVTIRFMIPLAPARSPGVVTLGRPGIWVRPPESFVTWASRRWSGFRGQPECDGTKIGTTVQGRKPPEQRYISRRAVAVPGPPANVHDLDWESTGQVIFGLASHGEATEMVSPFWRSPGDWPWPYEPSRPRGQGHPPTETGVTRPRSVTCASGRGPGAKAARSPPAPWRAAGSSGSPEQRVPMRTVGHRAGAAGGATRSRRVVPRCLTGGTLWL